MHARSRPQINASHPPRRQYEFRSMMKTLRHKSVVVGLVTKQKYFIKKREQNDKNV